MAEALPESFPLAAAEPFFSESVAGLAWGQGFLPSDFAWAFPELPPEAVRLSLLSFLLFPVLLSFA